MKKLIFLLLFFISFFSLQADSSDIGILASLNSWVEKRLSGEEFGIISLFLLFLGGLLASFLPCTYPLYPITAGIIKKRSTGNSKWVHPLTYYIGLSFMYMLFGLIAAFTGGAFNQIVRLPVTNLVIAFLIFLLGLSSVELIMIPVFGGNVQSKSKGLYGTFILGMGAGLLSSPCVGPIVVTILLQITTANAGEITTNVLLISSFKMLFFGLGLGIPFLLIGAFGLSLPKSGKWMKYIQFTLGGLVLYFAYVFFEKGMLGLGYTEKQTFYFGCGLSILFLSSYYLQNPEHFVYQKIKMAIVLTSFAVGVVILLNVGLGGSIASKTNSGSVTEEVAKIEVDGNLTWNRSREQAYKLAKSQNKKIFIDFYADWCTNCKDFQKLTQSKSKLNKALSKVVLYKVYDTDKEFDEYAMDKRFPELKTGLPFFVILDPEENLIFKTNDYLKTKEMIKAIKE
ncbi:MAG: thioredoxin family protein [Leptospiraceae bacterium]|nr:thioredoxin family protein [Leptospiraceae bacterium]MCP5495769.1 thioredoxin family protein [Leptospiraceae bacterium]